MLKIFLKHAILQQKLYNIKKRCRRRVRNMRCDFGFPLNSRRGSPGVRCDFFNFFLLDFFFDFFGFFLVI